MWGSAGVSINPGLNWLTRSYRPEPELKYQQRDSCDEVCLSYTLLIGSILTDYNADLHKLALFWLVIEILYQMLPLDIPGCWLSCSEFGCGQWAEWILKILCVSRLRIRAEERILEAVGPQLSNENILQRIRKYFAQNQIKIFHEIFTFIELQ